MPKPNMIIQVQVWRVRSHNRNWVTDLQHRIKPTLVEMSHYIRANVVHGWSKTLT